MKYFIHVIIGLIVSINVSAQTNKRIVELSGTISDTIPIVMTLNFHGNEILGFYFKDKLQTKILLEGQISGNKIILKESPNYDFEFNMKFEGTLIDSKFSGVWEDKMKKKSLKFKSSILLDKQQSSNKKLIEVEGIYENKNHSLTNLSSIKIKNIANEVFFFEISNGTAPGCIGYLKGLFTLTDFNQGVFKGESCEELAFLFSKNELILTEKQCEFHGMACPFEGKYQKKK